MVVTVAAVAVVVAVVVVVVSVVVVASLLVQSGGHPRLDHRVDQQPKAAVEEPGNRSPEDHELRDFTNSRAHTS